MEEHWKQFESKFAALLPPYIIHAVWGETGFEMRRGSECIQMEHLGAGGFGRVWKVLCPNLLDLISGFGNG